MQYRNTPLPHINLNPSQILFHRQLRDHLPAHPECYKLHQKWLISAEWREEALAERNDNIATRYNITAHNLSPLCPGTHVSIQDGKRKCYKRWNKTGIIVESLPNRQYHVKLDGSGRITLRNRRFLKPTSVTAALPIVSPSPIINHTISPTTNPITDIPSSSTQEMNQLPPPPRMPIPIPCRIPRALKCLSGYNTPGLNEQSSNREGGRDITALWLI